MRIEFFLLFGRNEMMMTGWCELGRDYFLYRKMANVFCSRILFCALHDFYSLYQFSYSENHKKSQKTKKFNEKINEIKTNFLLSLKFPLHNRRKHDNQRTYVLIAGTLISDWNFSFRKSYFSSIKPQRSSSI